jgi:hypothetical protein
MSTPDPGRGHERARELAALRADEFLAPEDEAWLADHLDFCDACAAVAADYDAQRDLFADLRAWTPEPPRDLWARTAAKIDAERGRGARSSRGLGRSGRNGWRLSLAPIAAVAAVVVVVGAGLLNNGTVPGGTAGATPIALADTAAIQVIVQDKNGTLHLVTRPMNEVCPNGVSACGAQPTSAVTTFSGVKSATTLQGAISPSGDKMVVVTQDGSGDGVYIVPVRTPAPATSKSPEPAAATPTATVAVATATPTDLETASALATASGSLIASAAVSPSGSVSSSPASASPSASIEPTDTTSEPPVSPSESPSGSAAPSASESASPAATSTPAPTPLPSVEVTPGPDAAIKIASGVTVVGVPVYAPDGVHLAFAAMPSDGSTGPDIYVWAAGDKKAQAITSDHGSWLAGWTEDGILASRVTNGQPATFVLDPVSGHATAIGDTGTWLPAVSPDGKTAAWWDGTLKLAADGVTWVPDDGRVVIGAWPNAQGSTGQTLAKGQIADWQARWSDDGSAVAVWVDAQGKGSGKLSLYRVEGGAPDLANPMLNGEPATAGFSLRTGRLAWTTPSQTPAQMVEVLAWSGKTTVRLEVPADGSGTVLP